MSQVHGRRRSLSSALSNEVRVEILEYLAKQGPGERMCARELAEDLDLKLNVVSYHVEVLDEGGAIRLADAEPSSGPLRPFYVFAIDEPWALAVLGLDDPGGAGGTSEDGGGTAAAGR